MVNGMKVVPRKNSNLSSFADERFFCIFKEEERYERRAEARRTKHADHI
jgi:hypothetical protein